MLNAYVKKMVKEGRSNQTKILYIRDKNVLDDYIKLNKPEIVLNCIGLLIEDSKSNIKLSLIPLKSLPKSIFSNKSFIVSEVKKTGILFLFLTKNILLLLMS